MTEQVSSTDDINVFNSITQKIQQQIPLSPEEKNFIITNKDIPDSEKDLILAFDKRNNAEALTDTEKATLKNYEERIKQQNELNSEFDIINKKLSEGIPLTELELKTITESKDIPKQTKQAVLQQDEHNKAQLPISPESTANLKRFQREKPKAAFEILHLSDTHGTPSEFEGILHSNLARAGHLEYDEQGNIKVKDNVAIAITGDLGTDFFDQQRHGLETYLTDSVIDKAQFSEAEATEFKEHYEKLMEWAGIDENMIREMNPFAFQGEGLNAPFYTFLYGYVFGMQNPHFLTKDELKNFRKSQKIVQKLLKKGMKNHSKNELTQIKKNVLEKYGITPAMVWGNHDIPDVAKEVLSDYIINPGEVKDIKGIKFGNFVTSANGNFTNGPDFNDTFGYAGWKEDIEKQRFESEPFQKVKNILEDQGLFFEDREIKKYMDISTQRAAQGIGTGALGMYDKKHIEPLLRDQIIENVSNLKKNIPHGADVIIGHSMLDDPQESGIEEKAAHRLLTQELKNEDVIYLHGHKHGFTTHKTENVSYLNNGSAIEGNSSVHLFDKNKKYLSSLYRSVGSQKEDVYRHIKAEEVSASSSGKYNKSA